MAKVKVMLFLKSQGFQWCVPGRVVDALPCLAHQFHMQKEQMEQHLARLGGGSTKKAVLSIFGLHMYASSRYPP